MLEALAKLTTPSADPLKTRAVLERQIARLEELQRPRAGDPEQPQTLGLKVDFAAALARDALKQILPPDSSLYSLYTAVTGATLNQTTGASEGIHPLQSNELAFYKLALENIEWSKASNEAGTLPEVETTYTEVGRLLPGLIRRHWIFNALFAAMVAVVGFAALGVIRFGNMQIDIQTQLDAKKAQIQSQIEKQKETLGAMADQTTLIASNLASAQTQISAVSQKAQAAIQDAQTKALENATKQIGTTTDATKARIGAAEEEAKSKLRDTAKTIVTELNAAQGSQVKLLEDEARKRLNFISNSGLDDLKKSLRELRDVETAMRSEAKKLRDDNSQIAMRQGELRANGEALTKGLAAAQLQNPGLVERAAIYLREGVLTIQVAFGVLAVLFLITIILMIRNFVLLRRIPRGA